ncbi:hypothetical protein EXIGLDRAFT_831893 [Exidia glandulosa HHB12029]|uniref:SET domain-containing protein n=1 Tax=Exidia glandulosa HHB12029 TaxID=1314781 RepID=A0A165M879_EXIGL|nr:hypothetical protein EXIGLDRAFT_831893 [Exidia glandulosa HHB12029]
MEIDPNLLCFYDDWLAPGSRGARVLTRVLTEFTYFKSPLRDNQTAPPIPRYTQPTAPVPSTLQQSRPSLPTEVGNALALTQTRRQIPSPSPELPTQQQSLSIAYFSSWQPGVDRAPATITLQRRGENETVLFLAHPYAPELQAGLSPCVELDYGDSQTRPRMWCNIPSGARFGDTLMREPSVISSPSRTTPLDEVASQKNFLDATRTLPENLVACIGELPRRRRVQSPVLDLFYSNAYRLAYFTKDGSTLESDFLFFSIAQIPHSCAPNAYLSWAPNLRVMKLIALRDIKQGEDITISYLPPALCLESSFRRQAWLQAEYGFQCRCTACTNSEPHHRFISHSERGNPNKNVLIFDLMAKLLTTLNRYNEDGLTPRVLEQRYYQTHFASNLRLSIEDAANGEEWRQRATMGRALDDDPRTTPALTTVMRPGFNIPVAFAVNDDHDYDKGAYIQCQPSTSHFNYLNG